MISLVIAWAKLFCGIESRAIWGFSCVIPSSLAQAYANASRQCDAYSTDGSGSTIKDKKREMTSAAYQKSGDRFTYQIYAGATVTKHWPKGVD